MEHVIESYDYIDFNVKIIKNEKGCFFNIYDYDGNNILDNCLYCSEDKESYFDSDEEAKNEAEIFIINNF